MKDKILELRAKGLSYREIVKQLGCNISQVSYYCGEGQREKNIERQRKNRLSICKCGDIKTKISVECASCNFKSRREVMLSKTIESVRDKKTNRYPVINSIARILLEESEIEKKCKVCGFDFYVEVCHLEAINSFAKETTIKIVNDISNLIYLCPNHHKMLDLGGLKDCDISLM